MHKVIEMHKKRCATNVHHMRTTSGIPSQSLRESSGSSALEYGGAGLGIVGFGVDEVFAASGAFSLSCAACTWMSAIGGGSSVVSDCRWGLQGEACVISFLEKSVEGGSIEICICMVYVSSVQCCYTGTYAIQLKLETSPDGWDIVKFQRGSKVLNYSAW